MHTLARARPAILGGPPTRATFLPFARPHVGEPEIAEVVDTLRSGWLATGKKTAAFEQRFAAYVGNAHAVAVTSGTAALQLALEIAGVRAGDEVITSPLTYVAAPHEILHRGATPIFADIDPRTFNLDPARVEQRIGERTKAILLVHFAGRPCDMQRMRALAERHGIGLISDSAHAIEGRHGDRPLASWFPLSAFSFHPVKNLTTAEGGMVTTDDAAWAEELRLLRLHGVSRDAWTRHGGAGSATWDVVRLGYKCNMSDLQASIGLHQLDRLEENLELRARLFQFYDHALANIDGIISPAPVEPGQRHACHMYTILVDPERFGLDRTAFCAALRAENIGTGHHYPALHRTTFYRERLRVEDGALPHAGTVADRIVTLPLHGGMTASDAGSVIEAIHKLAEYYG